MDNQKKNIEEKFRDWLGKWPKIQEKYIEHEEFLVYIIVGCSTTIVSWLCKFLANIIFFGGAEVHDSFQTTILALVTWTSGVIYAYFTNRAYVFKSHEPMLPEAGKFVVSRISTFFLDYFINLLLDTKLGINIYVTTFIAAVLVFITNYVLSKLLVFKDKKDEK